ncbi:MAG: FxsA family protein [Gammaproteobacteria bacterium]|nr:FxsA family protein [Gammaproteobacteria bacterium]
MKWILLIIVLGVAEVATIGQLHSVLGTGYLVLLYIVTTAIGALFLYLKFSEFKAAMKATKGIQKKLKKRAQNPGYKPTSEEIERLSPMMFVGLYVPALILIAIPGVISDIIGLLMVLPGLSSWLVRRQIDKAIASADLQS